MCSCSGYSARKARTIPLNLSFTDGTMKTKHFCCSFNVNLLLCFVYFFSKQKKIDSSCFHQTHGQARALIRPSFHPLQENLRCVLLNEILLTSLSKIHFFISLSFFFFRIVAFCFHGVVLIRAEFYLISRLILNKASGELDESSMNNYDLDNHGKLLKVFWTSSIFYDPSKI